MSYYLMHRGWMDNPAFKREPFTDVQAWGWLIEQASYQPHYTRYGNKMIEVGRGQIPTSYRNLKEKFKWGNQRVAAYLAILEQQGMLTRKTGTGFLIITICNYEKYQRPLTNSGTEIGTVSGTPAGTQSGTNIKKGKEIKEVFICHASDEAATTPETKTEKIKKARVAGTRLNADWELPVAWGEWALSQGLTRDDILKQEEKFRDYWIGLSGAKATKSDWAATWRNWIRNHIERFSK